MPKKISKKYVEFLKLLQENPYFRDFVKNYLKIFEENCAGRDLNPGPPAWKAGILTRLDYRRCGILGGSRLKTYRPIVKAWRDTWTSIINHLRRTS